MQWYWHWHAPQQNCIHHASGHYPFGVKHVEVRACICKGVAKFLHHISDTLDLRIGTSFVHLVSVHGGDLCPSFSWNVCHHTPSKTCHLISPELGNEVFYSCMRYQDVILFPPSMELERKQLGLYGVVCLSSHLHSFVYLVHQLR